MPLQGQIEAKITKALIKFEKEFTGRGPVNCATHIHDDLVIAHLTGIMNQGETRLTQEASEAEKHFVESGGSWGAIGSPRGHARELVKSLRRELYEKGRLELERTISELTGQKIIAFHLDMSTRVGDMILVFVLKNPWKGKP